MNQDGIWSLVSAEHMRKLDAQTISSWGVSADVLMESAGRAVVDAVLSHWGSQLSARTAQVMVLCGVGHNGGDGLVVARHLALLGYRVSVTLVGSSSSPSPLSVINEERAKAVGVRIETGEAKLPEEGVLVDALLGTGLSEGLREVTAKCVQRINEAVRPRVKVVSIDMPTGIHSETGQVLGSAVKADLTVTIGCPKIGLTLEPGRSHAGEIRVARVGIADTLSQAGAATGEPSCRMWSSWAAAQHFPRRPTAGHKGRFGHVLLLAGSDGMAGAAALSATAVLRAGAGLVTLGCPVSLREGLEAKLTEAMVSALPECPPAQLARSALEPVLELSAGKDVIAVGPGLGQHAQTRELVLDIVSQASLPLILDADGLNALEGELSVLRSRSAATVLTPHPGEAARLLGISPAEINADRVGCARRLAKETESVVLLKGAGSVVAQPEGATLINPTGGAYLAMAGTGDVLTGMVAAFLAQGIAAPEAAALGAFLHGASADRLAAKKGTSGLLATEIAAELPECMQYLREQRGQDESIAIRSTLLRFPEP